MTYWVAGATVASAVVGAVASNSAANKQAAAQRQAAATQAGMFNTINQQEQPFIQSGYGATTQLNQLLGTASGTPANGEPNGYLTQTFNPTQADLQNYPGYQFALQTGGQAVRNADTPGAGALSGAALKDLTNFNVGTANQYYGQYFNQFQTQQNNIFSRLSQIAGLGQSAATQTGNVGTQLAQGTAQAQAAAGASQAAGTLGVGNSISQGTNTLGALMYMQGGQNPGTPNPGANQDPAAATLESAYGPQANYLQPQAGG